MPDTVALMKPPSEPPRVRRGTFITFLEGKASTTWPSTLNFWSLGILNCWFVLLSSARITDVGGVTCQTLPVTVWIVVTIRSLLW